MRKRLFFPRILLASLFLPVCWPATVVLCGAIPQPSAKRASPPAIPFASGRMIRGPIKAAAPFSLKLMESFFAENPRQPDPAPCGSERNSRHQFAYSLCKQDAGDESDPNDLAAAERCARSPAFFFAVEGFRLAGFDLKLRDSPTRCWPPRERPRGGGQKRMCPCSIGQAVGLGTRRFRFRR